MFSVYSTSKGIGLTVSVLLEESVCFTPQNSCFVGSFRFNVGPAIFKSYQRFRDRDLSFDWTFNCLNINFVMLQE